jgi:hypothetical protein
LAEYAAEMLHGFPLEWMADGPPRLCERGHPVGAACGTCGDLREARKEWTKVRAMFDEDRLDRRKDIADCRLCDFAGRVWVGDDPDPWWCDHGWHEPPLTSFATVSSVAPVNCEAVDQAVELDVLVAAPCSCGRPAPVDPGTGLCYFCALAASKSGSR